MRDLLDLVAMSFTDEHLKEDVATHINGVISLLKLHYVGRGMNQVLKQRANNQLRPDIPQATPIRSTQTT